jgi:protein gp37
MGSTTGIEWTNSTWNPAIGCRRVSPGCAHCYAEKLVNGRMGGKFSVVRRAAPATFNAPLRWQKKPVKPRHLVFLASLSDIFIEEVDAFRDDIWAIIRQCPDLTFQILTKRPERISDHLPSDWGQEGYPNVWLGTSGETLDYAFKRGMYLSQVHAKVHFLSAEPWLQTEIPRAMEWFSVLQFYEWVILGGESGPMARPMNESAAKALRDACVLSEVPFFFKQWGGHPDARAHEKAIMDGKTWKEFPS